MGRGDQRSRKGKIFAGSHGKTRPKHKKKNVPSNSAGTESETKKATRKKKAE